VSFSRRDWAQRKAAIATALVQGECGGGYGEAVLVLCTAISAIAAEVWPGDRIDRRRFIELLVRYSRSQIEVQTVSVPLLLGRLRETNALAEERTIRKAFADFVPSRVLTGRDVDRSEADILGVCSALSVALLREFSYANLLYQRVRSALTHEYRTGQKAVSFPMTGDDSVGVSYYNWIHDVDRHIYFHVPWLAELTVGAGETADTEASKFPLPHPPAWWIEG
jgi:hypothetical protein